MSCTWSEEIVTLIRTLIFDLDSTSYRYTDSRLRQVAIVAAHMLISDVSFSVNYSVNIANQSITPDPAAEATRNDNFINLTAIKAACIIAMGEARDAVSNGVTIQDSINKFSSTDKIKGMLELAKSGYCSQYENSKYDFSVAQTAIGVAVMSPINLGYPIGNFRREGR